MERNRSVPRGTGVIPMHQIMHKIPGRKGLEDQRKQRRKRGGFEGRIEEEREGNMRVRDKQQGGMERGRP